MNLEVKIRGGFEYKLPEELNHYNQRLLYVFLILEGGEQDKEIVKALRDCDWFTHIILVVMSPVDRPHAVYDPVVREAVRIVREKGKHLIWMRWFWPSWVDDLLHPHLDPSYYRSMIRTLRREQKILGAVAVGADVEPYGKRCPIRFMKDLTLLPGDREAIGDVIQTVVDDVGPVDLLLPTASSRSTHYCYAFLPLGFLHMNNKTHYVPTTGDIVVVNAPTGSSPRFDYWVSNVGLGRPEDVEGGYKKVTVEQVKGLGPFPVRGVSVYAVQEILPQVIRSFNLTETG